MQGKVIKGNSDRQTTSYKTYTNPQFEYVHFVIVEGRPVTCDCLQTYPLDFVSSCHMYGHSALLNRIRKYAKQR